ncbi:phosphotransferase [Methylogaea oryzae]|uniref:Aminoglycoside phosphotransferase domain-containing protein n=1 Tax=Methylogaea oryzae TaxID=1295382 RepID=A0A8D5AHZ8_9GAMM|nr:phosphotransferase [Methylogaea oryzae]BBL70811.1 hypothetical protein MoryE10_14170 [Methylogaea oryzae]
MFLTASNLAHYLAARGTLAAGAIVDGDFMVVEAGRRNRNFKVIRKTGAGLFVKQIKQFDAMAISTLQREAACYRLARQHGDYANLAAIMPSFIDHDANRHCLIVELLPSSENLSEYHMRRKTFPAEIGTMLGEALGGYHKILRGKPLSQEDLANFPRQPPWILSFHQHSGNVAPGSVSGGAMQVGEIVRRYPDLQYNLERLRGHWQYNSIIHGDMKWDNCIVYPGADDALRFKIIDWELVDYGDACWDIGGILQSCLSHWILSMPLERETSPDRWVEQAAYRLESLHPAIRAFWQSYRETSGIDARHAYPYLLRSIEYGAARMVQTAFESLYYAKEMTRLGATLLQVSQNILRDPKEAASALYGFGREAA